MTSKSIIAAIALSIVAGFADADHYNNLLYQAESALKQYQPSNVTRTAERYVKTAFTPSAKVKQFDAGATYQLCFVPDGPSCEALLIENIDRLHKENSLLIQAYSFTDPDIQRAVIEAFKRGVDVRVIVDKSQVGEKYTAATFLKHAGIPVVIDKDPAIAHNKVMIFNQTSVFTGSFNFTRSAQDRNAENGIVIHGDPNIVKAYTDNWVTRFKKSVPY